MNRRTFLRAAAMASAGLRARAQHTPGTSQERLPNFLFVIADDWSAPHAGVYGDPVVQTPNFDRVAREGVLFHRAYCAAPSCTPSRGAILTGQAIHRLEEGGNLHSTLPAKFPVYPDLLEQNGYTVGFTGKGWGPGKFEPGGRTRNPAGPAFTSFAEFLDALPPDKPFCFWHGSHEPHRPYEPGSGRLAGMDPAKVAVPPIFPDTAAVRNDMLDYYLEVQRFDQQLGELLGVLERSGRAERTLLIVTSDNGMPFPRCKTNLYDSGCRMPLAIRWPGMAKPGRASNAFVSLADVAPTILEAAGLDIPTEMTGKSLVPILQSDGPVPGRDRVFFERERHANVRRGDLSYPARAVRTERYLYVRNLRPERWPAGDPDLYFAVGDFGDIDGGPTKTEVMSAPDSAYFRLACAKRPEEELYDCESDPHQTRNVVDDPKYAGAKSQMRSILEGWMKATDDPRSAPGGGDDRWDRYPYYGGRARSEARVTTEPAAQAPP